MPLSTVHAHLSATVNVTALSSCGPGTKAASCGCELRMSFALSLFLVCPCFSSSSCLEQRIYVYTCRPVFSRFITKEHVYDNFHVCTLFVPCEQSDFISSASFQTGMQ